VLKASELVYQLIVPMLGDAEDLLTATGAPTGVQLILTDPPYGVTDKPWDVAITDVKYKKLRAAFEQCLVDSGTVLLFTSGQREEDVKTLLCSQKLAAYKTSYHWVKTNPVQKRSSRCPVDCVEHLLYLHKKGQPNLVSDWAKNPHSWRYSGAHLMPSCTAKEFVKKTLEDKSTVVVRPEQKPVRYLMALILMFTTPGQLVVDPFMGVGSTAVACALTGRRFWGCDSDGEAVHYTKLRLRALAEDLKRKKRKVRIAYNWHEYRKLYCACEDEKLEAEDALLFEKPLEDMEKEHIEDSKLFETKAGGEALAEKLQKLSDADAAVTDQDDEEEGEDGDA
jgi:DNA modification methylase